MYSIGYKPLWVPFCKRCPVNNLHILVLLCHGSDLVIRLFLQQQKEEKMAESSYNSKGEQMAWDDREIIAQFLCRDEAAIKNTVDKYERYCSSIAYRILGNGEDVRECLNDTWLKLWESIPPTVPEILSAYVGKITRNLAINRYDHLHFLKYDTRWNCNIFHTCLQYF